MTILSKGCNLCNFESHNSLNLNSGIIGDLFLNFAECESFWESNFPDICALCETNLDDSIDSGNFSVRGYLPLLWNDSFTHKHGLAVYVKVGVTFAWELSLESSADSSLCFWLYLLHSLLYFFFLYWSPPLSLSLVFDAIWSSIDEVLLINQSVNMFIYGDFNVHHDYWLNWVGELCYNFCDNLKWLFLDGQLSYLDPWLWLSQFCSFVFISFSDTSICSTMAFPPLENSGDVVVSVSIDSVKLKMGCLVSYHSLCLFLCWFGWSLIILEMFRGRMSLN